MALEAFVFDMDGVIIDSEPLQVEAERWVCDRFGISVPEHLWSTFKGRTNRSIFGQIVRDYTDGSIPVQALISGKRGHYIDIASERLTLIPGAIEFLRHTKSRVRQCGLVTSSGRIIRELVFNKFSLHRYFDQVVSGDEVVEGKPHPEPYLLVARKFGVRPSEMSVLEDSDNGIRSAVSAGCHAIGITTSFPREVLIANGASDVVASYAELYAVLDALVG